MTIVYIVASEKFFLSHRLSLALKAKEENDIVIVCPFDTENSKLSSYGFKAYNWRINRGSLNPFSEFKGLLQLHSIIKKVMPDVIHAVAVKPILYLSLVSLMSRVKEIPTLYAFTGLGYLFISKSKLAKVLRKLILKLLSYISSFSSSNYVFQNPDDEVSLSAVIPKSKSFIIRGSGVDINEYPYSEEGEGNVPVVVFPARLLLDKGVVEFVEAASILKKERRKCSIFACWRY
jgi:glycosyltransferase involved in cell wall biosynthesis